MNASARLLLLPLLASMTLVAADEGLRNPFWPKGYEGERTPISAEVRKKPKPKPKPKVPKVDQKAAAADKVAKEAAAKKDAAAKEAAAREAAAKEAAAKEAAAKAAAEKAAREAAEKAEAERKREITPEEWKKARKSLKFSNPAVVKTQDGQVRATISINGNIYGDGDYMSTTLDNIRFTWRIRWEDGGQKLRLEHVRARRLK
jgi:hypothetical protein